MTDALTPPVLAPLFENIPAVLRALDQWVCWRREPRPGEDKPTKVPYNPRNGAKAKAGEPETWSTFAAAVAAYKGSQSGRNPYSGVGFQLHETDGFFAGDLDKCIDEATGEVADWASAIIAEVDTYTEYSPSGVGLRFFGVGALPPEGNRKGAVELYDRARYVTVTGRRFGEAPAEIHDRSAILPALHARLFPPKPPAAPRPQNTPIALSLSDQDVLAIASRAANGAKFDALWRGDVSGYDGESEADMALCSILGFYCQGDEGRVERLFSQSGLGQREKWSNREDYRRRTIGAALAGKSEFYTPSGVALIHRGQGAATERHQEGATGAKAWEPLLPFASQALPPFPVEALPDVLAAYVREIAASSQVPADMAAMLGLAVVAAAAGRRASVSVGRTHAEPLNLFVAVVMEPGSRKSAIMDMAAPLREHEAGLVSRAMPVIAAAKETRAVEEKRAGLLREMAAKEKDAQKRGATLSELQDMAAGLTEIPAVPKLLIDNITTETVATVLAENAGAAALLSAEGGIFGILAGRYSKGEADLDVFLKGHAGDEIRVDRKSRPPEFVRRPALTMGLLVQPDVIATLADSPAFRGRGLLGRFLYSVPESLAGTRKYQDRPVEPSVKARYDHAVERILSLPSAGTEEDPTARHALPLMGDALALWATFADDVEARQAEGRDLAGVRDFASKLAGQVARIAGGFHLLETAGGDWRSPLTPESVAAAWAVGQYLIPHALAAFGQMGADPRLALARRIVRWIERTLTPDPETGEARFTLRDCQRAHTGGGQALTAEDVQAALLLLVEREYLRPALARQETGGRPGSAAYAVNPAAFGQKSADE